MALHTLACNQRRLLCAFLLVLHKTFGLHLLFDERTSFVRILILDASTVKLFINLCDAITFPHFSHLETSNGSYIGIKTLTLGSGEGCSRKILFMRVVVAK